MRKAGVFNKRVDTTSDTVRKIVIKLELGRFLLNALSRLQKSLHIHNINVWLCFLPILEIGFLLS